MIPFYNDTFLYTIPLVLTIPSYEYRPTADQSRAYQAGDQGASKAACVSFDPNESQRLLMRMINELAGQEKAQPGSEPMRSAQGPAIRRKQASTDEDSARRQ